MSQEQLTITKDRAVKAHEEAGRKGKHLLENLFGEQVFSRSVFDRLQSFETVCADQGKDPADYAIPAGADQEEIAAINFKKGRLVAKALNEGWEPDFTDSSQVKYEPVFKWSASAGAFVYGDCGGWNTVTRVGARLCLKSIALCEHYGKYFADIHNEIVKPAPAIEFDRCNGFASMLQPQSIYEKACTAKGISPLAISHPMDKLEVIIEFLNEGWIADYSNSCQPKYEPWFEWSASAGAFVYYDFAGWRTRTGVGARLCYKDVATLKKAVNEPEVMELYNQILNK